MKTNRRKKAFTLIELLVVVLIIGILAAVAVPQYQKAIEKTKAVQAWAMLDATWKAAQIYHLNNGTWPTQFDELDINVAPQWTGTTPLYSGRLSDVRSNGDFSVQIVFYNGGFYMIAGRLKGPYKGGGFVIYGDLGPYEAAGREEGVMYCMENTQYGVTFPTTKPAGSYCQRIFKSPGALDVQATIRVYPLP